MYATQSHLLCYAITLLCHAKKTHVLLMNNMSMLLIRNWLQLKANFTINRIWPSLASLKLQSRRVSQENYVNQEKNKQHLFSLSRQTFLKDQVPEMLSQPLSCLHTSFSYTFICKPFPCMLLLPPPSPTPTSDFSHAKHSLQCNVYP